MRREEITCDICCCCMTIDIRNLKIDFGKFRNGISLDLCLDCMRGMDAEITSAISRLTDAARMRKEEEADNA